jgi:hypothetical protein
VKRSRDNTPDGAIDIRRECRNAKRSTAQSGAAFERLPESIAVTPHLTSEVEVRAFERA